MQAVLQPVQRGMLQIAPDARRTFERNGERQCHAGKRGMHARFQHQHPQHRANHEIGQEVHHAQAVEHDQHGDGREGRRQIGERKAAGVEQRDDGDGAEIVDDGQSGEEDFQRGRHAAAEQRQDTQRKGDVGGGRDRPAGQCRLIVAVDGDIDQRRNHHAAGGGDARQHAARPGRELAVQHLALDLQPDQQEEDRHQPVIDPQQQRLGDLERAELDGDRRVEQAVIEPGQRRIGQDQRQDGGTHQDEAAGRLQLEELAQSVQRHRSPPNRKASVYS